MAEQAYLHDESRLTQFGDGVVGHPHVLCVPVNFRERKCFVRARRRVHCDISFLLEHDDRTCQRDKLPEIFLRTVSVSLPRAAHFDSARCDRNRSLVLRNTPHYPHGIGYPSIWMASTQRPSPRIENRPRCSHRNDSAMLWPDGLHRFVSSQDDRAQLEASREISQHQENIASTRRNIATLDTTVVGIELDASEILHSG